MTQREIYKQEIDRMQKALQETSSYKLKNDYGKAIRKMKKELLKYDQLHSEVTRQEDYVIYNS